MRAPRTTTRAVRNGVDEDSMHGAVMPPLYLSANYSFTGLGQKRIHDYARTSNPNRDQLATALAELEGGAGAVVTNSGMAAVTLISSLLTGEDMLLAPNNCYGGCHRAFEALARAGRLRLRFVDFTKREELESACAEHRPRMIWLETPSNPLLRVSDIEHAAGLARRHGALLVVDNTFLSPLLQRPLALGADLVLHSTTKFINGHSDVIGGAVVAADAALAEELAWWANCLGLTASPFDCFLTQRGLRSLHARLRCHEENTGAVVELLCRHDSVTQVHYPGLPRHPDHELARRQQSGYGSIVSFELAGDETALHAFLGELRYFTLAESLGGVESLVCHPASMTHSSLTADAQEAAGLGPGLLRLSVGIEHGEDLVEDLESALDAARRAVRPPLEVLGGA